MTSCATPAPRPGGGALAQLPGWDDEDHVAALGAIRAACAESPAFAATATCRDARDFGAPDDAAARLWLERHFRAEAVPGDGILTAYFSPDYDARRTADAEFSAPLRPAPPAPDAAGDRAEIERSPAPDALAWLRPEDLFALQVQGSGVLTFPDHRRTRAVFAAANGRPFAPIARAMIADGYIAAGEASADAVNAWLTAHRGPLADAMMDADPRYIFFRLEPADASEPRGAAGVPMISGRSVAVDPAEHRYFDVLWIDAESPALHGAAPTYRRLVVALDTGGAIKGPVRADLYLGAGAAAGREAARVDHTLLMYHLVPIAP